MPRRWRNECTNMCACTRIVHVVRMWSDKGKRPPFNAAAAATAKRAQQILVVLFLYSHFAQS